MNQMLGFIHCHQVGVRPPGTILVPTDPALVKVATSHPKCFQPRNGKAPGTAPT